jgi:prolyl 4-hydroxylase
LGLIPVHSAAADGSVAVLKEIAQKNRSELFKKDRNGWRPLHEAARGGQGEAVEYLLKEGAQINERTNDDAGASPLWWAERKPEQNKKAIEILKKHGAISLPPRGYDKKPEKEKKKQLKL